MQIFMRLVMMIVVLCAVGMALWLSMTLIGVALLAGAVLVVFYAARQFLLDRGILNRTPGVSVPPGEADASVTIIETSYTTLDDRKP